jgi:type IX secretion system PorP/SprF family membrane protein
MKIKTLCVVLLAFVANVMAQDAQFSQFYSSALYLNPALAGSEPDLTFSSNYRQQWRSLNIPPYATNQVSLIVPYHVQKVKDSHRGGGGFSFYNDKAGDGNLKTLGVNLTAAYNIALSSSGLNYLSFGMQGGVIQKSIDYTNLEWGSQYNAYLGKFDENTPVNESNLVTTRLYPDVNAGMIYYYNAARNYHYADMSAYAGVAGYHLTQPNESFLKGKSSRLPMLLKFHAGLEYNLSKKVNISPNVAFFYQNQKYQFNGGMYLTYHLRQTNFGVVNSTSLILGAWYRLQDSFILSMGLSGSFYTIGFSYDLNSSNLRTYTNMKGAWEVSLTLRRITKNRIKRFATPRI